MIENTTILRLAEVQQKLGISRSSLYLMMKEGTFPPSISIGARSVGVISYECEKALQAIIKGDSKEELKELVVQMVAARAASLKEVA